MAEQTSAVAPRDESAVEGMPLPVMQTIRRDTVGEVERVEQAVKLPAIFQYAISRYNQAPKVMITSDGYDYLNRAMGVQLYQPEWVNNEAGEKVRNPIHQKDYIYLRLVGIWYNDLGQMMSYREDVEVDFKLVYHDARINARSAKIEIDEETGEAKTNPDGSPKVRLSGEDELKALKALSQLRTFGLRYAHTVAKTRILKTASGVRTLPLAAPKDYPIRVVGFRDNMTPDERIEKAEATMKSVFGSAVKVDEKAGLTPEEIREARELVDADDMTEEIEQSLASADRGGRDEPEIYEPAQAPTSARRVGPRDEPEQETLLGK